MREDTRQTARSQAADIERSRRAAEESARAATRSIEISERSARAAEQSAQVAQRSLVASERHTKAAETSANTEREFLELTYEPAIEVQYNNKGALNIFNRAKENLTLWGVRYGLTPVQSVGTVIAPGSAYPFYTQDLLQFANRAGPRQLAVRIEIFVAARNEQKYVATVDFWAVLGVNNMDKTLAATRAIQPLKAWPAQ